MSNYNREKLPETNLHGDEFKKKNKLCHELYLNAGYTVYGGRTNSAKEPSARYETAKF